VHIVNAEIHFSRFMKSPRRLELRTSEPFLGGEARVRSLSLATTINGKPNFVITGRERNKKTVGSEPSLGQILLSSAKRKKPPVTERQFWASQSFYFSTTCFTGFNLPPAKFASPPYTPVTDRKWTIRRRRKRGFDLARQRQLERRRQPDSADVTCEPGTPW
jgi:hypothetical protein